MRRAGTLCSRTASTAVTSHPSATTGRCAGRTRGGTAQRGPLIPNADGPKVRAAFEAKAEGASWSQVAQILEAKSKGATAKVISNRVYLGEARSGKFVRPNAHPALVDDVLFRRANRRKTERSVSYGDRNLREARRVPATRPRLSLPTPSAGLLCRGLKRAQTRTTSRFPRSI